MSQGRLHFRGAMWDWILLFFVGEISYDSENYLTRIKNERHPIWLYILYWSYILHIKHPDKQQDTP